MDPYAVLGVPRGASRDEVRAAYRALAVVWHPDRHQGAPTEAEATRRMQQINAAYERLEEERAARAAPEPPRAEESDAVAQAYALLRAGRISEAERGLMAVAAADRDAQWWRCLAACKMRSGDIRAASAAFANAAAMNSSDRFSRGMAGMRRVGVPLWRRAWRALTRRSGG